MSQFNVDSLADLNTTPYSSEIAANKPQSAGPFQQMIRDVNDRLSQANDAVQARASSQAAAALPAWSRQGELAFNTTSSLLFLDPDGNGHDDQLATELSAYQADFATAGTGTFRFTGTINSGTTSYTLPGNSINRTGAIVKSTTSVSRTSGAGEFGIFLYFGNPLFENQQSFSGSVDYAISRCIIVRTGASTAKYIQIGKADRDDGMGTSTGELVISGEISSLDFSTSKDFTHAFTPTSTIPATVLSQDTRGDTLCV